MREIVVGTRSRGEGSVAAVDHPRLIYRPEVDGLRAISVVLVLAFHLGVPFGDRGQTGVTVFFVLSGFLITRLLLAERRSTGRIAIAAFYVRRARRLLPALIVMLAVVAVMAVMAGRIGRMTVPIVSTLFYFSNIAKGIYGFPMAELGHTWTLGVEEQFYLVWPFLLLVFPRWIALVAMALVGVFLQSGFDAIAVGAALAMLQASGRLPRLSCPLVGLAVVGVAALAGTTLLAVAGGMLLVWSLATTTHRAFAWRPLVAVGRISYGIYLWQYPVLMVMVPADAPLRPVVVVVLTLGLAALSWFLVERRFLSAGRQGARAAQPVTLGATA